MAGLSGGRPFQFVVSGLKKRNEGPSGLATAHAVGGANLAKRVPRGGGHNSNPPGAICCFPWGPLAGTVGLSEVSAIGGRFVASPYIRPLTASTTAAAPDAVISWCASLAQVVAQKQEKSFEVNLERNRKRMEHVKGQRSAGGTNLGT
jgi:hypothetical protein